MDSKESVVLDVALDWRVLLAAALLLIIGAVAVVTAGAQGPLNPNGEVGGTDAAVPSSGLSAASPSAASAAQGFVALRSFYLTDNNYPADEALSVCTDGYHMASLWELLDVSGLAYAYDHPDAHTKSDSGQGPPSHWYGRVRTGWSSSGADAAGIGNCRSWTSTESGDRGAIARLTYDWTAAGTAVGPWETDAFTCGSVAPVWCVQDVDQIRQIFLPLVLRG